VLTGLTPRAFLAEMRKSCRPNDDHEVSFGLDSARARRGAKRADCSGYLTLDDIEQTFAKLTAQRRCHLLVRRGDRLINVKPHRHPRSVRVVPAITFVVLFSLALVAGAAAGSAQEPRPVMLRIIFPEGFTAGQMADRVSVVRHIAIDRRGVTPRLTGVAYTAAVKRTPPPRTFAPDMKRRSLEGFLFPATYGFTPETTAATLVANQVDAFAQHWRTVDLRGAKRRGRTPYDVLTIASMIERETVAPEERRLVSAVIYNRLEGDMVLGIDATLRYGLGIPGNRSLTKTHLASDSPYNTRRFKGLPPTPIGNPGVASIRAAAKPARVNYLYYVRKPDGIHHFFTADEEEFCRKAREYGYSC
jgi:cell division protein YceG involved in septum cleavage